MYETNLSYEQVKHYLTILTWLDLLAHNSDEYMTTDKGQRFLKAYTQLQDVLNERAS